MLPDRVSNPGPLSYESGALPIALRGPAQYIVVRDVCLWVYQLRKWWWCSEIKGEDNSGDRDLIRQ